MVPLKEVLQKLYADFFEDQLMARTVDDSNIGTSVKTKSSSISTAHSVLGALVGISITLIFCLIVIGVKRGALNFTLINPGKLT